VLALAAASPLAAAPRRRARPAPPRAWDEKRIGLPRVGSGVAFVPHAPTTHVVIMLSGAGGWDKTMNDAARRIAAQAVVVGLSYPALKRAAERESGCWYVASDFEIISHAAQKVLALPQYHPPILVGFGDGAAVVYAAMAGGPATTFAGVVSAGFCPTVAIRREICSGDTWSPEYDDKRKIDALPPAKALPKDWYVLEGVPNRACSAGAARGFAAAVPKAHLASLDAFERALQDLWTEKDVKPPTAQPRNATTRELEDDLQRLQLPLEFRWPAQVSGLLVFFSGDGGWASLDEEVAEHLITRGIGVVGVSSLRYFWQAKTPAQVGGDLRRMTAILARAARPVFAGGFSFGAEVVPVALAGWTPAERRTLSGLVLIAPGPSASFEIDPLDWIRKPQENPETRVAPAVRALSLPTLCLAGADEEDSPCPALANAPGVHAVRLPGSHHFNSNYSAVADTVAQFIRTMSERRP
jgi:type IV secretory pathway VirJ component